MWIRLGGGLPRSAVEMMAAPVGHTSAIPTPSELGLGAWWGDSCRLHVGFHVVLISESKGKDRDFSNRKGQS